MSFKYSDIPEDDRRYFGEFLRLAGAPAGSINAGVDGSVTPQVFKVQPDLLSLPFAVVTGMIVMIEDAGNLNADDYGAIAGPVANAVQVAQVKNAVEYRLDGGEPITDNVEWGERSYDLREHTFGSGSNFILVRWTFAEATPLILRGADHLKVTVSADLGGLDNHTFMAQGWTV